MITYKQVDESYFKMYDEVPMVVHVKTVLVPRKLNNGLGGIIFDEIEVEPYIRNIAYDAASDYTKEFDIRNWAFFMAFDGEKPVGAITAASKTKEIYMLDNRDDLSILWDIRVDDFYKRMGVGTELFKRVVDWSRENGLKQLKIECQTNNVPACKFYAKQGAILREYNEYACVNFHDVREHEIELIWYLDL